MSLIDVQDCSNLIPVLRNVIYGHLRAERKYALLDIYLPNRTFWLHFVFVQYFKGIKVKTKVVNVEKKRYNK